MKHAYMLIYLDKYTCNTEENKMQKNHKTLYNYHWSTYLFILLSLSLVHIF